MQYYNGVVGFRSATDPHTCQRDHIVVGQDQRNGLDWKEESIVFLGQRVFDGIWWESGDA